LNGGSGKAGMSKISTDAQRRLLAHDAARDRKRRSGRGSRRRALLERNRLLAMARVAGLLRAALDFGLFALLMLITQGPLRERDFEWLFGDLVEPILTPLPFLVFAAVGALAAAIAREHSRISFVLFLALAVPAYAAVRDAREGAVDALPILVITLFYLAPVALLALALVTRVRRTNREGEEGR